MQPARVDMSRVQVDVSDLPVAAFGHRSLLWWGTLMFMAIEGTTLAIVCGSYLDLMRMQPAWPPPPTRLPDLMIPTINLAIILATIWPSHLASRAALRLDARAAVRWLWVCVVLGVAATALRGFELAALNTRWDDHVFGSLAWLLLGLHATLLLADFCESATIALLVGSERRQAKHFSDVEDAALYQWFLSLVWVPIYFLVYILPRM
jgi:cytochrome c oxidase subunit III